MEQTSSSAYPNILVANYLKKARVASSSEFLMKAEQYLNVGYQKLLTFERPGGGFDWWGNGEPLVWLSAYGLQEVSDMAKVYPIDRGIIDRTQAYLMRKMDKDGAWSLLDSGMNKKQLDNAIQFIRANLKEANDNAYVLALAANALAAYDPKD